MHDRLARVTVALSLMFGQGLALGQAVSLIPLRSSTPSDREALDQVAAAATLRRLKAVEIFNTQSFRVVENGRSLGIFVMGRATDPKDKENLACFVSMVQPNVQPALTMTTGGAFPYSLLRCGVPRAVGLVETNSPGETVLIGVIYSDSMPLGGKHETSFLDCYNPVVFSWNKATGILAIDEKLSEKAGDANTETLAQLRRALRP